MSQNLSNLMDELFDDFYSNSPMQNRSVTHPSLNVSEYDDRYETTLRAPGINPKDLIVELKGNILTLSFEQSKGVEKTGGKLLRREYSEHKSFKRSLKMPSDIQTSDVKARYDNGIFTITLLKEPESQPKQIKVEVG